MKRKDNEHKDRQSTHLLRLLSILDNHAFVGNVNLTNNVIWPNNEIVSAFPILVHLNHFDAEIYAFM